MKADIASWLLSAERKLLSPTAMLEVAANLVAARRFDMAATACDAAYSLAPESHEIVSTRKTILERLRIEEHGLVFCYIPAGPFVMGSKHGDNDESPEHPVELEGFWITDVPLTWAAFHDLMGWPPPPNGVPDENNKKKGKAEFDAALFHLYQDHKIRRQYCETETVRARDWHAHAPEALWQQGDVIKTARELFGDVARKNTARPWTYDEKPMVAVSWEQATALGKKLTTSGVDYGLPTEAEWEKAARGGLVGCKYAWGNEPPTPERCDFDRFRQFSIRPPRSLPPNGYGLFGMCGGVREWTADGYDATYYGESPRVCPTGPTVVKQRVLRGGSWADCADAVRVSFRMGLDPKSSGDPTIGFRLVRRQPVSRIMK
jgi:formylglycine-generating enzyme required for sulfatase activity